MSVAAFAGKWQLDLDKSEPITPMLEALKVNPVYRKASLQLQVTQDISLLPSDPQQQLLRICNKSSFGTSITTQLLNAGNQSITDPKTRETSVYNAKWDANAEYPISIFCELPNQTGFTKDHRRLLAGGREMEQKIEFRASRNAVESVVMQRYWTRIGLVPAAAEVVAAVAAEAAADVTAVVPVAHNQPPPQELVGAPQDVLDWPGMCVLFGFASLTMMLELYVDCAVCLSALGFLRLGGGEEAKQATAGAGQFGLVPVVLGLATRTWFASPRAELRAATVVLAAVALAWTQRERLVDAHQTWAAGRLFALSTSAEQADPKVLAKYWMELCGVLAAATLVATTATATAGGAAEMVSMAALCALARYRLDVAFRPLPAATPTTPSTPPPQPERLAISVTESRLTVDPRSGKSFAQYLVRAGQTENWVRYSDLLTCYGDICLVHAKFKAVAFPPKVWHSTSDSVMASRVDELNETFVALAALGEQGTTTNALLQVHSFRQFVLGEDQRVPQPIAERRLAIGQVLRAYELVNEHSQVGSGAGWELVDANRRIYSHGGNRQYKQVVFLPHLTVRQAVDWVRTSSRSAWDREFQGEVALGVRVEEEEGECGVLEIAHKRVFWGAGGGQAEASEVLQTCLYGRAWVEVALPHSLGDGGFAPRAAVVTGFVFQPAGAGATGCVATYVTSSAAAAFKFAPVALTREE